VLPKSPALDPCSSGDSRARKLPRLLDCDSTQLHRLQATVWVPARLEGLLVSETDENGPLPFVPEHTFGLLVERDGQRLVVWQGDGAVEPAEGSSASDELVAEVDGLLRRQLSGGTMADVARLLESAGFTTLGDRRFNFRSGELYQDARVLAMECFLAGADRATLLARHGNRHPRLTDPDWMQWEATVRRMNATAKGARVLGVASLEAFVNEVLLQRCPKDYQELELGRRPSSPLTKLRRLMERQGLSVDTTWFQCVGDNFEPRRSIVHHRPGYVDDVDDPKLLAPSEVTDPAAVRAFLACLDAAFEAVFTSFGWEVPSTHQAPGGAFPWV
jgi:hypothetical protein